ncbi:hypothetical protein SteCoe_27104 [Stentor coeruleus]|uniref:Uncharacterized protein n=1 Tax=Stentor coeruleus TaxID=5963 RepID=A0A1R2BB76_9CILI|nr:hypothetical protein SteCoe_27104 [Stentor coeruleus]
MKFIVALALLGLVSANTSLEQYGVGQTCQSDGGFTISSFNVYPYPPTDCSPQAVSMTGTFTQNACPSQININENYNQRQSYTQNINLSGCYVSGTSYTFNFNINAYQCNSGSYVIQVALNQQSPQTRLACWQYEYSI